MLARLSALTAPFGYRDIVKSLGMRRGSEHAAFERAIRALTGSEQVFLVSSGIAAFYIILKALKNNTGKKEVILPAYTAGSLVMAVRKAGLKPVPVDISIDGFCLDEQSLLKTVSKDTLAVVAVHLFGIPDRNIASLRESVPEDIFLIEDCAQASGSRIKDRPVGSFGDAALFSFGRGKNISLCGGGCITSGDKDISAYIYNEFKALKDQGSREDLLAVFSAAVFRLATNPYVYGAGFPLISRFKENSPQKDFTVKKMCGFQAGLGAIIMERFEDLFLKRYKNGISLINALSSNKALVLPVVTEDARPVFNRLPVLFKDAERREMAQVMLLKSGIESSRMYLKPIHQMFDMGYSKDAFPAASYVAECLLTLPVHPAVRQEDLERIGGILRGL